MEIKDLEKKIVDAQNAYYNGEDVTMSDAEFDDLWDELTRLDPTNPILHKVGKDSGSSFEKVKHLMPMNSQQKSTNAEEFRLWARDQATDSFLVEYKCDGSSIELQYSNGKFVKAVTRGNGTIGDDVTENISKAKGVVKELKDKTYTGAVRGEVVLYHEDFEKYFKDKANCRNAANGIMKRKNSDDSDKLTVVCYDAMRIGEPQFKLESSKIQWLSDNGFNVVYTHVYNDISMNKNIESIVSFRDELTYTRFKEVPYDIDGIVIKCPEVDIEDQERDRPNKQIAFKFILSEQPTIVRGVEWSVNGKTRTPVAICDPVYLCGTTVKRANICNIGVIRKLGLKIGSKVMMVKRGEIIPKIERVLETPSDAIPIQFPETCECCGSKLFISDTQLYCPNRLCANTLIHRLIKWSEVNKIYGVGEAVATDLYNNGIRTVKDLYTCSTKDIANAIKSDKNAAKIKANIDKTKVMDVKKFIAGYDLDEIGETTVKNVLKAIPKNGLEDFLDIYESELSSVSGFAEISAENICSQLREFKNELLDLATVVEVKMPENIIRDPNTYDGGISWLCGVHVAFTGELESMKRSVAMEKLEESGGIADKKITSKTKYLVCNKPSNSAKFVDARANGVEIINEKTFFELLKGSW